MSTNFVMKIITITNLFPRLLIQLTKLVYFFFSSRRRHTRCYRDWSDVCSSDLHVGPARALDRRGHERRVSAALGGNALLQSATLSETCGSDPRAENIP